MGRWCNERIHATYLVLDSNPDAPEFIQVGIGDQVEKSGEMLSNQSSAVYMFIKETKNGKNVYKGTYCKIDSFTDSETIREHENRSKRHSKLTRIIQMRKATSKETKALNLQTINTIYHALVNNDKGTRTKHPRENFIQEVKPELQISVLNGIKLLGLDLPKEFIKQCAISALPDLPTPASEDDTLSLLKKLSDIQVQLAGDTDLSETERDNVSKARIGQSRFKKAIKVTWGSSKCAVTGCSVDEMIVASHIKAWSDCETNTERLDGANGLLLIAHLDKLFDRHKATFKVIDGSHKLVFSNDIPLEEVKSLGIEEYTELNKFWLSRDEEDRFNKYMLHHNSIFDKTQSNTRH